MVRLWTNKNSQKEKRGRSYSQSLIKSVKKLVAFAVLQIDGVFVPTCCSCCWCVYSTCSPVGWMNRRMNGVS